MNIEKTVKSLEERGFSVKTFSGSAEAADYLCGELKGHTVGIGGSKTVEQLALHERLDPDKLFWHWLKPSPETLAAAACAEVYISSANAISETGEIVNIDGTGNRIASIAYGHKKVYIVAGTNKITDGLSSAVDRAQKVAGVLNCRRFEAKKTPCKLDGVCHDCRSKDRICKGMLILMAPMSGTEFEVILIDEQLGF